MRRLAVAALLRAVYMWLTLVGAGVLVAACR